MASWDQKLCSAVYEGNIKDVELSLKNGANLENTSYGIGMTPLMLAAGGGHLEVMKYLASQGSQLEATSPFGETALHFAAEYGQIDVTKWLIDRGFSPWVKTKEGLTPYGMATINSVDSEEKKRKKKEVMDFLETVMSTTPPEVTPDTQSQKPSAPVVGEVRKRKQKQTDKLEKETNTKNARVVIDTPVDSIEFDMGTLSPQPMKDNYLDRIREIKKRIVQDIQISKILDHMMTHLVLSADDRRDIEHYPRQDDQNTALLDIVIKRREPAYSVFVDGLRKYGYEDIANDLKYDSDEMNQNTASTSADIAGLSDWNVPLYKVRLQKNYLKVITDIQHESIVDHLITKEVVSVDDGKKIESGKTPQEKNRNLMDMLLCKNEQDFNEFIKALRKDSVYADLADQIEKTDVTSRDMATLRKCLK